VAACSSHDASQDSWRALEAGPGRLRFERSTAPGDAVPTLHLVYSLEDAEDEPVVAVRSLGDVDAAAFDHLVFRIRGDAKLGFGEALKVQLRRRDPTRPGAIDTGSFVVTGIGDGWQRVEIPLNRMPGLRHRDHVESFAVVLQRRRAGAPTGAYYLDAPALVALGHPGPGARDPVPTPRKRAWEEAAGGPAAARELLRDRLVGWPRRASVDPAELPRDGAGFLRRVARDTWNGLDALRDRESGLPLDTVRFGDGSVRPEEARIGDFTNVTDVGLYLAAVVAARDLGLLSGEEAHTRADRILTTLEGLESDRGFFYNYYDTTSLERTSNFVSFVDSSWLTVGLLLVRGALPDLARRCSALVERQDFGFLYDPVEQLMHHGYWVNLDVPSEYHYGWLFTEARVGSLIAIGKGDVPVEHWQRLVKRSSSAGARRWRDLAFVPSWGGSMFEALMPVLFVDEPALAPGELGRNDRAHAVVQRRYALEVEGREVWGASPAVSPSSGVYTEFGVPVLGLAGYPAGAVAPYATALALAVLPDEAAADLQRLAGTPGLYGEFGFYDALDPGSGRVARAHLALDQAMLFLALANQLEAGAVQRRFAADPIAARALPLVAASHLFD